MCMLNFDKKRKEGQTWPFSKLSQPVIRSFSCFNNFVVEKSLEGYLSSVNVQFEESFFVFAQILYL